MYSVDHHGSRRCFRCALPLTDAASLDVGVGPICRKLDNALLARLIPSDLPLVLKTYVTVDVLTLAPDTVSTFLALEAAFRDPSAPQREDWRKQVKAVEWMLSHHQSHQNVESLKNIVLALGYVGIVALWSGEAATGLASVFCLEGRLAVSGPLNKAARIAFRKIAGSKFHGVSAEFAKAAWSFPAGSFEAVKMAVSKHYPHHEGLGEAVQVAQAHVEALKAAAPPPPPAPVAVVVAQVAPVASSKVISITEAGDTLQVKTPFRISYIGELRSISKLTLPRKWDPDQKVWIFPVAYKAQVEALVKKHYGHC